MEVISPASTPAGWYPDPWGQHEQRYWDGSQWTGSTQDGAPKAAPPPSPRRLTPIRVLVALTALAAVAFAGASFAEDREKLAFIGVALALPLVAWNTTQLARARSWPRRSILTALTTWMLVITVVAVGGYRGFQTKSCAADVGPDAKLAGCDLSGRDLTDVDLRGADLSGANLSGSNARGVDFIGANLSGATLENAILRSAHLDQADLRNATLRHVDAKDASWSGANLSGAKISDSDLSGSSLDGVDLHGVTIEDTSLASTDLSSANFAGATLTRVTLDGTTLENVADLSEAALAGAFAVDPLDVAQALNDRGLFLDSPTAVENQAAAVCSGTPVPSAGTSPANGSFVVVVNQGDTSITWPTSPPALRYLEAVVCVGAVTSTDIDVCGPYYYEDGSLAHPITRYRESVAVRILNPATGAVMAEQTFDAPDPESCPSVVSSSVYSMGGDLDLDTVQDGVNQMVTTTGV